MWYINGLSLSLETFNLAFCKYASKYLTGQWRVEFLIKSVFPYLLICAEFSKRLIVKFPCIEECLNAKRLFQPVNLPVIASVYYYGHMPFRRIPRIQRIQRIRRTRRIRQIQRVRILIHI